MTIDLTRIGELDVPRLPTRPGWTGPSKKRLVRFVIQTDGTADLAEVDLRLRRSLGRTGPVRPSRRRVRRLTAPVRGMPGRFPTSGKVGDHLDVRPMFPGAEAGDRVFKLADFFVLALPITLDGLSPLERPDPATLFELAYQIRERGGFVRVEPEQFYKKWSVTASPPPPAGPAPSPPPTESEPPSFVGFSFGGSWTPGAATADHAWNLRSINWPSPNNGGFGITVGQVDTGSHSHRELIDVYGPGGLDVTTGTDDSTDRLRGPFPGHGVATASVLASRGGIVAPAAGRIGTTGPDPAVVADHEVTGVANRVRVIPVRTTDSVIIVSNINVAEGVWHCVQQSVDVITVSLGGYANQYLERVVSYVVFRNVIVVAAGGQYWPFVPAPALYRDCIAATGSTVDKGRWLSASLGRSLDIAAPAEHVWVADFDPNGREIVRQSAGTSFASPTVAGVAALWLAARGNSSSSTTTRMSASSLRSSGTSRAVLHRARAGTRCSPAQESSMPPPRSTRPCRSRRASSDATGRSTTSRPSATSCGACSATQRRATCSVSSASSSTRPQRRSTDDSTSSGPNC